jgi:hypothetical protein
MSRLDMKDPRVKGPWYLADYENYATDDYLFAIPQDWAAQHTPGLLLATGRFRDGSLGGSGPALFAFGPWNEGNPPASRARLTRVVPLLLYGKGYEQDGSGKVMDGYTSADEWTGGEWLTAGEKSAVVFAGTRGRGNFWYGFSNGVIWPDNPPYPEYPPAPHNDRGWWADSFEGVLLFYNPADLAKVALGTMAPHEPQPYGEMKIDQYLWHISGPVQKMHVGDVAFDRERRYLYLVEPFADGDQPIIHVFALTPSPDSGATVNTPAGMMATAPASRLKGTRSQQPAAPSQAVQNPGGDEPVTRVPGFTLAFAIAGAAVVLLLKRNGY